MESGTHVGQKVPLGDQALTQQPCLVALQCCARAPRCCRKDLLLIRREGEAVL